MGGERFVAFLRTLLTLGLSEAVQRAEVTASTAWVLLRGSWGLAAL